MCLRHRLRMVWLPGRHRTLTTRSISNSLLQQDNPREGYARCRAQVPRIRSIMNRHHSNVRHQLVDPVGFPSHVSPVPAVDACPSIGVSCLRRPLLANVETSPESCGPLVSERGLVSESKASARAKEMLLSCGRDSKYESRDSRY